MRIRVLIVIFALAVIGTVSTKGQSPAFAHLDPGGRTELPETVPINIVFVGYEPSAVNESAFLDVLPETYQPIVRSREFYRLREVLGLRYQFAYNVVFTNASWENRFFGALSALAMPTPTRTLYQDAYNAQIRNVRDVGQNHFIDAPSVEKWLIDNAPGGVDTRRNTIFFINWWGRADFKFHVYTKFGEPDPDTGYDFGVNRQTRKVIAWGGTTAADEETGLASRGERRVWFHDLSAGPEAWTDNWNVDDADVDGDGVADYRLPPIWEYVAGGARAPAALTQDLALVTRFVAINLLFTSSPLYPPYLTPTRLPASINLDSNTYEGWRGVDASTFYQTPSLLVDEVSELHSIPYNVDQQDLAFSKTARNCYQLWLNNAPCYPNRPYPGFANLFLYSAFTLSQTRDGGGDYEGMLFNYVTEDNRDAGFLGFADDNWVDGTQSGVFSFLSPAITALGYGLTTTQIHEFGHHIGMSHPHDGWDSELEIDYGPGGSFYFAWAGDESNSIMSYVDLNWDFSQFDQDNFNRFHAAGYIINSNAIAAQVLSSSNAGAGLAALNAADVRVGLAKDRLAAHDYPGAFEEARQAYLHVRTAAAQAGVAVNASDRGWLLLPAVHGKGPNNRAYSYVDRYGPGTKRSAQ
jgi:hypothetical protein